MKPAPQIAATSIRELDRDDARSFQRLRLRGLVESTEAFSSSYDEERHLPIEAVAERIGKRDDNVVFGAFTELDDLVGVVGLVRDAQAKRRHCASLWGLYVAPEARGGGLGRRLVEAVIQRAAAIDGVRKVYLGVGALNAQAMTLYSALGFVEYGRQKDAVCIDGHLNDQVMMDLALDSET